VGQTYRRRKRLLYLNEAKIQSVYTIDLNKTAVFAIPLFYPILMGRRAGIVSLASSSNVTWLVHLDGDELLAQSIAEQVTRWWELLLRRRLVLPTVLNR
jgi:hypothetical protein